MTTRNIARGRSGPRERTVGRTVRRLEGRRRRGHPGWTLGAADGAGLAAGTERHRGQGRHRRSGRIAKMAAMPMASGRDGARETGMNERMVFLRCCRSQGSEEAQRHPMETTPALARSCAGVRSECDIRRGRHRQVSRPRRNGGIGLAADLAPADIERDRDHGAVAAGARRARSRRSRAAGGGRTPPSGRAPSGRPVRSA